MKAPDALGALLILLTGCATSGTPVVLPPRPSEAEVQDYVRTQWATYDRRLGVSAGRKGESATLISVSNVICTPYYIAWACAFDVTAQFGSQPALTQRLVSQYDCTETGALNEIVLLVHERR